MIATGLWDDLTDLSLRNNPIGNAGAHALAAWDGLASLRLLDLDNALIGPVGALALLLSPHLEGIEVLKLRKNSLDAHEVEVRRADGSVELRTDERFAAAARFGRRVQLT